MIVRLLLSPWIFYFLAVLGLILATLLVIKGKRQLITAKILEDRTDSTDFVYDMICAEFPKSCVLKDAPVSCADAGGVQITQALDIVYVSRGGVMIISVINGDGAFDNPKTGPWRYRYIGPNEKTVTTALPNPFDTTIPAANILEGLLAGEKIYVDVQKITVFSGNKVGMTTHYPEAVPVSSLISCLRAFDQRAVLNGPQFRLASEVITAFAQYNQHKAMSQRRFPTSGSEVEELPSELDSELEAVMFDDADTTVEVAAEEIKLVEEDETTELLHEAEGNAENEVSDVPEMILNIEGNEAE